MTKNLTIRLPDDVAADAEAVARVDGTSLNETVKQPLIEAVERRRKNPKFKARLAKIIKKDRELLERLARWASSIPTSPTTWRSQQRSPAWI